MSFGIWQLDQLKGHHNQLFFPFQWHQDAFWPAAIQYVKKRIRELHYGGQHLFLRIYDANDGHGSIHICHSKQSMTNTKFDYQIYILIIFFYLISKCIEEAEQKTQWPFGFVWFVSPQSMCSSSHSNTWHYVQEDSCTKAFWFIHKL